MTRDFWEGYVSEPVKPAPVQEPVATVRTWHMNGDQHAELGDWELGLFKLPDGEHTLYTTPPAAQRQWVGLTGDEREQIYQEHYPDALATAIAAVEAKLKEKNK